MRAVHPAYLTCGMCRVIVASSLIVGWCCAATVVLLLWWCVNVGAGREFRRQLSLLLWGGLWHMVVSSRLWWMVSPSGKVAQIACRTAATQS